MALTKETLRANESLAGLSDEQVSLIETLSRNDENTVIGNKIGELHGNYDADILAATGIAKQQGEKTYDYLKRAAGEIKRRADKSDEFQQKVTALTGERDALREQLKAGGAGDLSAQLAAKEAELKNTKKLYADTKADLDKLTKESVSKMTALQIGYEIKGAAAALKFKPEIPQAVADLAVQNIVKELETAHKPEFIPDGNGGQRLVSSRSTAKKHTEDIIMQNRQNGSTGSNSGSSFDSFFNSNPSHSMGSASSGNQSASSANWNTEAASSIDTKDLSILQDEMYSEALLFKKCTVYAGYFNDPALKRMAENAAGHHRRHFDTLHGYLNGNN